MDKPVLVDLMPEDLATSKRIVDPAKEDQRMPNPTAKLLRVHHALNHLPFSKIKMLAREGKIPRKLHDVAPPMCSACAYGKAT
jgi:hypothetical protein